MTDEEIETLTCFYCKAYGRASTVIFSNPRPFCFQIGCVECGFTLERASEQAVRISWETTHDTQKVIEEAKRNLLEWSLTDEEREEMAAAIDKMVRATEELEFHKKRLAAIELIAEGGAEEPPTEEWPDTLD